VRRLLLLVSVLVLVDTMLYAAMIPLLPHFAGQLHLTKAGAGALVAAYAAGALLGGLPGGRAAALLGPRRAVLVGLALMGSASIGFALAESFGELLAARAVQGAGSAFTWAGAFSWLINTAPGEQRGEMIGRAMGAAVFGELLGPVIGVAASTLGRAGVFSSLAVLAVLLAVLTARIETDSVAEPVEVTLMSALRAPRFTAGLGLLAIGSMLFGVMSVLAPLHLAAAGWGPVAIGAMWLVAAAFEGFQSPAIGRLSDRRGPMTPARLALIVSVPASLGLATGAEPALYAPLLVIAGMAYGALFTPSFSLVAEGADRAGLAQGMAFGLMNAAWATGAMVGPSAAGLLAKLTGDSVPFLLAAAASAAALLLVRASGARPARLTETAIMMRKN